MSCYPTPKTIEAMELIRSGQMTPYQAAKTVKLALTSIYRSSLYKEWLAEGKPGYIGNRNVKGERK